jgi:hypothetical protein
MTRGERASADGGKTRLKRNVLTIMESDGEDLGFEFKVRKSGEVEILHSGRRVTTLRGMDAQEFLAEAADSNDADLQQVMARLTGNYKRGNERTAADHPRNRGIG